MSRQTGEARMAARVRAAKRAAKGRPAQAAPAPEEHALPQGAEEATAVFPVVGIGASAGGLAAFEAFFSGMPADTDPGMAFVLVQHLAPDHKSILTELIRRYTRMQVFEVEDGMRARPNCAYIIPPNRDMAFLHGTLQLLEPSAPRGQRLPIDFFFRSLAQDQRERAICIVLSGTGRDGTLGVRAIKGEGGMAMAQVPESTEFDGMPRSAIATGLVDFVLPPAEMPARLISFTRAFRPARTGVAPTPAAGSALKKILILLRAQTGHDFSQYKPGTTQRRVERRMAVHQIETMEAYVKYAQQTPAEVDALFRDLLIGVTRFFRDPEAFAAVEEKLLPQLLAGKPAGATLRVWSPGCSTGEEAYSLAIVLAERKDALKQSFKVLLFATDIDSEAIATARTGVYPASIEADVSPERLARFFTRDADGSAYRIHKGIRDMIVFSEQDVIKDPPFSRLDLISCRNLLIYFGGDLQQRLIPSFHYALKPGAFLLLGTSESVGDSGALFATVDRKAKLYQRREEAYGARAGSHVLPPFRALDEAAPRPGSRKPVARLPLRELTEQALLQQVAPAGALVNGQGDILYLHGRAGKYLEPAAGEATVNNILKMAREGLRHALTTALHRAGAEKEAVRFPGLRIRTNGHFTTADLTVQPVELGASAPTPGPLFLVILEEVQPVEPAQAQMAASSRAGAGAGGRAQDARVAALRQELQARQEHLQTTVEELETTNEELKSSNEEMQSVNEELQSTNEEMETSKEELQSVNEELATVNGELQAKVAELSHVNNDMLNLMAGTGIGTVFVDLKLNVLRFTPSATQVINFIPTDVGRPLGHIKSNLVGYDRLEEDVQAVLATRVPQEVEVQSTAGAWFLLRIRPYRTQESAIEGAVINFVDITELKQLRQAERLAVIVKDSRDAITLQGLDGVHLAWNAAAQKLYGWTEAEALAMNVRDRIPPALRAETLAQFERLGRAGSLDSFLTQRLTRDGHTVRVRMTASAVADQAGKFYAIATTERPVEDAGRQ